jgi:hypothetical protein
MTGSLLNTHIDIGQRRCEMALSCVVKVSFLACSINEKLPIFVWTRCLVSYLSDIAVRSSSSIFISSGSVIIQIPIDHRPR